MRSAGISRNGWILFIFSVWGLILYWSALDNGFYFDDSHQITENTFIRTLDSIPRFFYEADINSREAAGGGHYRPLLLSTFVLNYRLGRLNPLGYHLINLLFHILCAYTLFLIVDKLLSNRMAGVVAGLVVLTHPFNSEIVNYVTARSSVMATFFYLLAFYAYLRYRPPDQETPVMKETSGGHQWYHLSWVAFLLGILTKEILITLPLVLLLYEWTFVSSAYKSWRRIAWQITPFLVLSLSYLVARRLVVGVIGPPVWNRDPWTNLLIQTKALAVIWQMLLFPVNLSLIHEIYDPLFLWGWTLIGSSLLLVGLIGFMVWALRSTRQGLKVIGFALAWFYITLLPTTLIPLNAILQENRCYIAGMAFAVMVGLLFTCIERWQEGRLKRVVWGGLGVVLVAYGVGTIDRNSVWDNEINLWQDAVHNAPGSMLSHYGLGMAYAHLGWIKAAADELRMAVNINGARASTHSDLGGIYMHMKQEDLAEKEYREAIRLDPQFDRAHTNLGILYRKRGELELARQELETALRIYPYSEFALYNMGMIYLHQKQPDRALALWTTVLKKNPNLPKIQLLVGGIYQDRGEAVASRQAFERAFYLDPSLKEKVEGSK